MNLLLVGGTGVLSRAVAGRAVADGHSVTVVNRGRRKTVPGCETVVSDKRNFDRIGKALAGRHFDVAIDFLVFNREDSVASFEFYSGRCDHYILVSSCFVYDFSKGGIMDEGAPRGLDCWRYSAGKCEAEDALVQMARQSPCNYTIVRPFVTYGDTRIPHSLAPAHGQDWTLVFRALAGKPLVSWDGGRGSCNIMRVEDFCTGLFGLLKNPRAYGEAVNVCGDETPCWKDVVAAVEKAAGVEIPVLDLPREFIQRHYLQRSEEIAGRSFNVVASNGKLKRLVPSFRQTISLQEGIARTISAYRENGFGNGVDWSFDAKCDEVVNAWNRQNGERKRFGFVNYLKASPVPSYVDYLNGKTELGFGARVFRKCLNMGLKAAGGMK